MTEHYAHPSFPTVPPAAVMMLTGFGHDTMVNSLLFLAGVLPSHVHGFYLSSTYFHRRRKARKGRYPGDASGMIASKNVLNGGLSSAECERRWWAENGGLEKRKISASASNKRGRHPRRKGSRRHSKHSSRVRDAETHISPVKEDMALRVDSPRMDRIHSWCSDIPDGGFADVLSPAPPPRS